MIKAEDRAKLCQAIEATCKNHGVEAGAYIWDVVATALDEASKPSREKLPTTRNSVTRTFRIPRPGDPAGEFQMYVIVGLYDDGRPGEIFIDTDKEGSFASAALDAAAVAFSIALQYGAPLKTLLDKWKGMRFPPEGATGDPTYSIVASPLDYLARWMLDRFCKEET